MAQLLTGSASAAAAKAKSKYLWQNEGPAQQHASSMERRQPTIPAAAVGGTLTVLLVDVSGLEGPHGLNPKEPPFFEIQIGEMMQCSRPASPSPGSPSAALAPGLSSMTSAGNSQIGWAAASFLQPQTFAFENLKPALPPSLQVSVFSRRNGTCERLVAIGHIILNQVWSGGWHTVNTTLVSRAKGAAPAHIRMNISFAAAPPTASKSGTLVCTEPQALRIGDLESPNSTLEFGEAQPFPPPLADGSPPRSPGKLLTRLRGSWRTAPAIRN